MIVYSFFHISSYHMNATFNFFDCQVFEILLNQVVKDHA